MQLIFIPILNSGWDKAQKDGMLFEPFGQNQV